MARPDLRRSVGGAAAVAQAGDLFRGVRPRSVSDDVRAALVADLAVALDLRMERRGAAAGAAGDHCRRLVLAVDGAAACHLGNVRQRCAEGADRLALYRAQSPRPGRPADLSRSAIARLGAPEMARQDDADAGPHWSRGSGSAGPYRLAGARLYALLLERSGRRKGGIARRSDGFSATAEIFCRAGHRL